MRCFLWSLFFLSLTACLLVLYGIVVNYSFTSLDVFECVGLVPSGPQVSNIHVFLYGVKSEECQEFMQF